MSPPQIITRRFAWWRRVYILIVGGILLYVLAWAADTKLLGAQSAVATVSGKEHREMRQTYTMERIGNVNRAVSRVVPEQYVLKLKVESKEVEWPVEKDYFRSVQIGQQVRVRYERRRFTGSLRVLSLEN
jgi:hypothetical protein